MSFLCSAAALAIREAAAESGIIDAAPLPAQRAEEKVVEVMLAGMGFNQVTHKLTFSAIQFSDWVVGNIYFSLQGRPILFVLVDDTVIAYEMFRFPSTIPGWFCCLFS